jgi:hypothetical protein
MTCPSDPRWPVPVILLDSVIVGHTVSLQNHRIAGHQPHLQVVLTVQRDTGVVLRRNAKKLVDAFHPLLDCERCVEGCRVVLLLGCLLSEISEPVGGNFGTIHNCQVLGDGFCLCVDYFCAPVAKEFKHLGVYHTKT